MVDDLCDLLAHAAGDTRIEEDAMFGSREDDLHEHRCHCGNYWTCRRRDCDIYARCLECEERQYEEWAEAHDPQPELPLEFAEEGGKF